MKKLLYIIVNSKPEDLSSSRTVSRELVNRFLNKHKDYELEELNLYECHIPRLEYEYFTDRNSMIDKEAFNQLDEKQQEEVHKIVKLTDQFKEADMYVVAAPMWSLSFPSPLKEYIDCIVMNNKTIKISDSGVDPLLNDKVRSMVYVQSSGGKIPWMIKPVLNKGLNYFEGIVKLMGIKDFKELLVDGTGKTQLEKEEAENKAIEKIDDIIDELKVSKKE